MTDLQRPGLSSSTTPAPEPEGVEEGMYYLPSTFPGSRVAAGKGMTLSQLSPRLSLAGMLLVALATLSVLYITELGGGQQQQQMAGTTVLSLEMAMKSYNPARSKSSARTSSYSAEAAGKLPNIVFILTDDQGMGDMDIEGSDFENFMPAVKRLNQAGWNLTSYYSASLCTPARASLMTGRYAVTTGMGHGVVMSTQPWGLPISETLMPELMQNAGYTTHHVGKWHLGHYSKAHLPTARGFNDSLGYYGGYQHPETYFYEWPGCTNSTGCLPDMHSNKDVYDQDGQFNSYTFADEAERIIELHGEDQEPFFLYLALPLIHMPVHPDPDVMEDYADDLAGISDIWRRRMGAMSIMLNSVVERVESSLIEQGLMNNTILVYASDNGAQCEGSQMGAGSNFPLRGSKGSMYEGAVRVPAFIYSPLLGHQEGVSGGSLDGLFHVSDWLPTLMSAAGKGDVLTAASLDLDGVDQWAYLQGEEESPPRTSVVLNVDTVTGISALRMGNYKLILNESTDVGWYDGDTPGLDLCFVSATQTVQLFDLGSDQEERTDVSLDQPDLVASMRAEIDKHIAAAPTPAYCGVSDDTAITKWFKKNQIEPWISLDSDDEGLLTDYTCPEETTSSGWCVMVDSETALPPPPVDGDVPLSMGGREIKDGAQEHDYS